MDVRRFDIDNNNKFFGLVDEVIQVPTREDIEIKDPEFYMRRLREITTPGEQLKEYAMSIFNIYHAEPTYEGKWTRNLAWCGLVGGWIGGALLDKQHLHDDYARLHNASVFDNHFRAKRHKWDTFLLTMIRRGMGMGVKAGLSCLACGFVCFGSVSYRNKLFYPDWAVGFAALGALSRSWLGMRGLVGGAGLGLLGGTIMFGSATIMESLSGQSISELRYHEEMEFAQRRQAIRDKLQRQREGWIKEQSA